MIDEKTISINSFDGKRFDAFLTVPEAGSGPGIVLVQEIFGVNEGMRAIARLFAEEGYVVVVPDLFWRMEPNVELGYDQAGIAKAMSFYEKLDRAAALKDIEAALAAVRRLPQSTGQAAVVGFCLGGTLALMAGASLAPDAVVAFYPVAIQDMDPGATDVRVPTRILLGDADPMCPPEVAKQIAGRFAENSNVRIHTYPSAGHAFFNPDRPEFDHLASELALTNMLELLRPLIGPHYDLVALWERHTYFEFVERDADKTIETMVERPYVNHVPMMTGGTGREELRHFYRHYFVNVHSDDYQIRSVSRTVGVNRLVDEMIATFTHDRMMDYFLPGVEPTGRKIMLATLGVVTFRGPKLRHEHLYYDQASVLVQAGLLDPKHNLAVGVEQTRKVMAPYDVPSNTMMKTWTPPT